MKEGDGSLAKARGRAWLCLTVLALPFAAPLRAATTQASFQLDVPYPTTDKPQSKLWFAHDAWWALLPSKDGPTLWERGAQGWHEHPAMREKLRGKPGRADVWSDRDGVTAISVAHDALAVLRLEPVASPALTWRASCLAEWRMPNRDAIETVTIARDRTGRWWIAAPITEASTAAAPVPKDAKKKTQPKQGVPRNVVVWSSPDAIAWQQLDPLATGISGDDICTVAAIPGGVAVIWSDQNRDNVMARVHLDGRDPSRWEPPEIIAAGGKTADDHLHAALAADGTLWLATKNSVDQVGTAQLVLRVRSPAGQWENLPYAPRSPGLEPSRPVVITTLDPSAVLLGHTVYNTRERSSGQIVFGRVERSHPKIIPGAVAVIAPDSELRSRINDVTTPKAPFPANAPWIVLASDAAGRVFEADLRSLGDKP